MSTRARSRRRFGAAVVLAVGALGACRQIVGVGEEPAPSVSACSVSLGAASSTCDACREQACCDELDACEGDSKCRVFAECLSSCAADADSAGCRAHCRAGHPDGFTPAAAAFTSCEAAHCAAECQEAAACGGSIHAGTACASCANEKCCDQSRACAESPGCTAYTFCSRGCDATDMECLDTCSDAQREGATQAALLTACVANECTDVCGEAWACLGSGQKPAGTAEVTVTLTFVEYVSSAKVGGIELVACTELDPSCGKPEATGTSDADGKLDVTLPIGFDRFFELTGGSPEIAPSVSYLNLPIASDTHGLAVTVIDLASFTSVAAQFVAEPEPGYGHIIARAFDCGPVFAAGVSLELDPLNPDPVDPVKTMPFYFAGLVPSISATATDAAGIGGFINVKAPSAPTLRARIDVLDAQLFERTLIVRDGWVTLVGITPNRP